MLIFNFGATGLQGVEPRLVQILTDANLATVLTAGWLTQELVQPNQVQPTDWIVMRYGISSASPAGTFDIFLPQISGTGVITLIQQNGAGDVTYTGTLIARHVAVWNNTTGTLQSDADTVINAGNFQAGLSGTAGSFIAYPATASSGAFTFAATANVGNTPVIFTNASMGQASNIIVPDPGVTNANVVLRPAALVSGNMIKASGTTGLIADMGAAIYANTTAAFAGGSASNTFTAANVTSTSIVTAVILTSTNVVSIAKLVPGSGNFAVTFSADPGANTTLRYIVVSAAI